MTITHHTHRRTTSHIIATISKKQLTNNETYTYHNTIWHQVSHHCRRNGVVQQLAPGIGGDQCRWLGFARFGKHAPRNARATHRENATSHSRQALGREHTAHVSRNRQVDRNHHFPQGASCVHLGRQPQEVHCHLPRCRHQGGPRGIEQQVCPQVRGSRSRCGSCRGL